jgi:hypothetical protein
MEEADVRENEMNGTRWALGAAASAVLTALVLSMLGGPAQAQDPIYGFPTPTPTATPTGTPFQNTNPPSTPEQPAQGPKLIRPFPVVRTAGSFTATRTFFTRVTVKAPVGVVVKASCIKKGSKCRLRRKLNTRKTVHLRPLERGYKSGTRIRLRLTAPGEIGKYVEIRTRPGKRPIRRDLCLRPGRVKPVSCGSG